MSLSVQEITLLFLIKLYKRIGRYMLKSLTGIGEGMLRRLLSELRDRGLIRSGRGGSEITETGMRALDEALRRSCLVGLVRADEFRRLLKCNGMCIAFLVRGLKVDERAVVRARDESVRLGSYAVLIMRVDSNNKLEILRTEYTLEDFDKRLNELIIETLRPQANDHVIVLCGDTYLTIFRSMFGALNILRGSKACAHSNTLLT